MTQLLRIGRRLLPGVLVAFLAASSPALASGWGVAGSDLGLLGFELVPLELPRVQVLTSKKKKKEPSFSSPSGGSVPELDPSDVGSAAVLLLGGLLVASGRRRRRERA